MNKNKIQIFTIHSPSAISSTTLCVSERVEIHLTRHFAIYNDSHKFYLWEIFDANWIKSAGRSWHREEPNPEWFAEDVAISKLPDGHSKEFHFAERNKTGTAKSHTKLVQSSVDTGNWTTWKHTEKERKGTCWERKRRTTQRWRLSDTERNGSGRDKQTDRNKTEGEVHRRGDTRSKRHGRKKRQRKTEASKTTVRSDEHLSARDIDTPVRLRTESVLLRHD